MNKRELIINYTEKHRDQLKNILEVGKCSNIECEECIFNIRNSTRNKKCSEIGNLKGGRWKEIDVDIFIPNLLEKLK